MKRVKLPAQRAGLPGNVNVITKSALTPILKSVTALPAGHPADLPVKPLVLAQRHFCFSLTGLQPDHCLW